LKTAQERDNYGAADTSPTFSIYYQGTEMAAPKKKLVKIAKNVSVSRAKEKKMEKKPGGSNVGEYKSVKKKEFAGTKGGAPVGSYPINTLKRAKAALSYAHYAPDPEGIKRAVYKRYPELAKRSKSPVAKRVVKGKK